MLSFLQAKAGEEDGKHSKRKRQKLRNNSCRDISQIQEKRKAREVSSSESSEVGQSSCRNDSNEVGYLSVPSENEMGKKIRELHSSLQDSSDEEPLFKDCTKVLKDTGKKSGLINKKLSELINTLWQQKDPLDKLKDEVCTYDLPQNCQKLAIKY